jgi:hypothetical protein
MHEAYSPVGYIFRADQYCLDCIPFVVAPGRRSKKNGFVVKGCNCCECKLDRMAAARGIDRSNEWSFDSDDFPKAIAYHNDQHAECGPEYYGYGPADPEWQSAYCGSVCAACHTVIDGESQLDGPDLCPVFANRKRNETGV